LLGFEVVPFGYGLFFLGKKFIFYVKTALLPIYICLRSMLRNERQEENTRSPALWPRQNTGRLRSVLKAHGWEF